MGVGEAFWALAILTRHIDGKVIVTSGNKEKPMGILSGNNNSTAGLEKTLDIVVLIV